MSLGGFMGSVDPAGESLKKKRKLLESEGVSIDFKDNKYKVLNDFICTSI